MALEQMESALSNVEMRGYLCKDDGPWLTTADMGGMGSCWVDEAATSFISFESYLIIVFIFVLELCLDIDLELYFFKGGGFLLLSKSAIISMSITYP